MYCTRRINDDYTWVGADGRRLAMFEGVFDVPAGISFNSYLLRDEKTVLFDTTDAAVRRTFRENLLHALEGRSLDCVVVHHMEPDHTAELEELVLRATVFRARYPNRNCVRFEERELAGFAASFAGTPFLLDHAVGSVAARAGVVRSAALIGDRLEAVLEATAPAVIADSPSRPSPPCGSSSPASAVTSTKRTSPAPAVVLPVDDPPVPPALPFAPGRGEAGAGSAGSWPSMTAYSGLTVVSPVSRLRSYSP